MTDYIPDLTSANRYCPPEDGWVAEPVTSWTGLCIACSGQLYRDQYVGSTPIRCGRCGRAASRTRHGQGDTEGHVS